VDTLGSLEAVAWDTQGRRLRRSLGDTWEGNWLAEDFYKVSAMGVGDGDSRWALNSSIHLAGRFSEKALAQGFMFNSILYC
jgi:hypothetical protein